MLAIDPTNHTTLYATGFGGLYKSDDDAASWRPVLAIAEPNVTIAVSPADRQLVYLALRSEKSVRIVRSEDGGATWQPAYTYTSAETACDKPVLLVPHPTDASRLFANVECDWRVAGDLYQSRDRGETWELLLAQGRNNFNWERDRCRGRDQRDADPSVRRFHRPLLQAPRVLPRRAGLPQR